VHLKDGIKDHLAYFDFSRCLPQTWQVSYFIWSAFGRFTNFDSVSVGQLSINACQSMPVNHSRQAD